MPTARTSESHPLRVAAVAPGDGYGRIGIPDRWLDRLSWKDRLIDAAHRLLEQDRDRDREPEHD